MRIAISPTIHDSDYLEGSEHENDWKKNKSVSVDFDTDYDNPVTVFLRMLMNIDMFRGQIDELLEAAKEDMVLESKENPFGNREVTGFDTDSPSEAPIRPQEGTGEELPV